jgi:hypothetical protein
MSIILVNRHVDELEVGDVVVVSNPSSSPGADPVRLRVDVAPPPSDSTFRLGPISLEGVGVGGATDGTRIRITYRHGGVPIHVESGGPK